MKPEFIHRDVPYPHTYSFRSDKACRYEHPIFLDEGGLDGVLRRERCPYRSTCHLTGNLDAIAFAYGDQIAVTLTESSSNIVVRSENQFNGELQQRMSLRKHFYELHPSSVLPVRLKRLTRDHCQGFIEKLRYSELLAKYKRDVEETIADSFGNRVEFELDDFNTLERQATRMLIAVKCPDDKCELLVEQLVKHSRTALDCENLDSRKLAKYLGFVDLRTNSPTSPIALALLVPPRDLRHDAKASIIQGLYGELLGGHSFMCSVFSMHDPNTGGAYCAQASLIMTLGILADRGANVLGSYDITVAALRDRAPYLNGDRVFPVRGLGFPEMKRVLCSKAANGSASCRAFPSDGSGRRMILRLVDAYINARCPVVLGVNFGKWMHRTEGVEHTVVIVGVRQGDNYGVDHEISEFIVHDPSSAPFIVRPVHESLTAAELKDSKISLLFASSALIKNHAIDCMDYIYALHRKDYLRYVVKFDEDLAKAPEMLQIYETLGVVRHNNYNIRLLHKEDIVRLYGRPQCSATKSRDFQPEQTDATAEEIGFRTLWTEVDKLENDWFWVIAMYYEIKLEVLWFFSASNGPNLPPQATVRFVVP